MSDVSKAYDTLNSSFNVGGKCNFIGSGNLNGLKIKPISNSKCQVNKIDILYSANGTDVPDMSEGLPCKVNKYVRNSCTGF
jgi:hypothetical protein